MIWPCGFVTSNADVTCSCPIPVYVIFSLLRLSTGCVSPASLFCVRIVFSSLARSHDRHGVKDVPITIVVQPVMYFSFPRSVTCFI